MNAVIVSFPLVFHIIKLTECHVIAVWAWTSNPVGLLAVQSFTSHTRTHTVVIISHLLWHSASRSTRNRSVQTLHFLSLNLLPLISPFCNLQCRENTIGYNHTCYQIPSRLHFTPLLQNIVMTAKYTTGKTTAVVVEPSEKGGKKMPASKLKGAIQLH